MAEPLMDAAGRVRYLIADRGYDANALQKRAEGAQAVIPGRSNRKVSIDLQRDPIQGPLVHQGGLLQIEGLPTRRTRYDKLARNFLSAVALATLIAF